MMHCLLLLLQYSATQGARVAQENNMSIHMWLTKLLSSTLHTYSDEKNQRKITNPLTNEHVCLVKRAQPSDCSRDAHLLLSRQPARS